MRARLLLLLCCALAGAACSGGYPLPPTRCDEFCDATKGLDCQDYYEPAGCVSTCEQGNVDDESCRAQFDALVSCFRKTPAALTARCDFNSFGGSARPCQTEQDNFETCIALTHPFPPIRE